MSDNGIVYSVFTKPWKMPVAELGEFVSGLGFEGIELPVRPDFQVEPQNVSSDLPEAAKQLASHGVKICSVAGPKDETTIAACAEAGVLGILPGVVGVIQAVETVKLVLGRGAPLYGRLLVYDALAGTFRELKVARNERCAYCADRDQFPGYIDYEGFCGTR